MVADGRIVTTVTISVPALNLCCVISLLISCLPVHLSLDKMPKQVVLKKSITGLAKRLHQLDHFLPIYFTLFCFSEPGAKPVLQTQIHSVFVHVMHNDSSTFTEKPTDTPSMLHV